MKKVTTVPWKPRKWTAEDVLKASMQARESERRAFLRILKELSKWYHPAMCQDLLSEIKREVEARKQW